MKPTLLQIQSDITAKLTVELASWCITVRSLRKLIVSNELDAALLTITDIGGRHGCACAVEMPTVGVDTPNVPGPQGILRISVLIIENPTENYGQNGTQKDAELVAERVAQLLHLFRVQNVGTMYASGPNVIEPTDEIDGHVGYRVTFIVKKGSDVLDKTGTPIITGTHEAVTITPAPGYETGAIYYTLDGESYPGPDRPNSFTYTAPFATDAGAVVRSAGYKTGSTGSDIAEHTAT